MEFLKAHMILNSGNKPITACVTGASGMIGKRLVSKLLARGDQVRVLVRSHYENPNVQVFRAGFSDEPELEKFASGADMMFHCAAELKDESKMFDVNVLGTEKMVELVARFHMKYFCHLSSAGVVGSSSRQWIDETAPCHPNDMYGKTKLEAEKIAKRPIAGCNTVILRPTTVVDETHLAELALPISGSFKSRLKAIFRGGECAHIVHAEDVAEAAIYFSNRQIADTNIFFVSLDDQPMNTVANLWSLHQVFTAGGNNKVGSKLFHFPIVIPHIHRQIMRRVGNCGNVRYTSRNLLSEGFCFKFGVAETVKKILEDRVVNGLS